MFAIFCTDPLKDNIIVPTYNIVSMRNFNSNFVKTKDKKDNTISDSDYESDFTLNQSRRRLSVYRHWNQRRGRISLSQYWNHRSRRVGVISCLTSYHQRRRVSLYLNSYLQKKKKSKTMVDFFQKKKRTVINIP